MEDSLNSSRCAVVVLCPTFIAKYNNECRFFLETLIISVDVIYIIYDGLDVATVIKESTLGAAITASIKNSCCLTWSWPIEDDANLGRRDKRNIARFWCHLKLAIPNRRRIAAAGVAAPAAAAAARPQQESSESDSAAAC